MIGYTGIQIARESISDILGRAPEKSDLDNIVTTALKVEDIQGVHDIILHSYGSRKVISLHIEVSNRFSVDQARRTIMSGKLPPILPESRTRPR